MADKYIGILAFGCCRLQQKVIFVFLENFEGVCTIALGNMGLVDNSYTRILRRKRVVVSKNVGASPLLTSSNLKKMCSDRSNLNSEMSPLETLPQEILLKVLCGVDHEDLEQLFHVSKTISEATLLVKELHFRFSTPKKNTIVFHDPIDLEDANEFREIEAPNAPLRKRKSRRRNMSDISVALFASMDEEEH